MHPDWARSLRDQCQAAGVPFFFKQWGEWMPGEWDAPETVYQNGNSLHGNPGHPNERICYDGDFYNDGAVFLKVGKHKAGRLLDGRTWDEFPEVADGT
jgi:protein gp37